MFNVSKVYKLNMFRRLLASIRWREQDSDSRHRGELDDRAFIPRHWPSTKTRGRRSIKWSFVEELDAFCLKIMALLYSN